MYQLLCRSKKEIDEREKSPDVPRASRTRLLTQPQNILHPPPISWRNAQFRLILPHRNCCYGHTFQNQYNIIIKVQSITIYKLNIRVNSYKSQFLDTEITSSEFHPGTVFWLNDPGPPGSWPFLGAQVTSPAAKNPQPCTANKGGTS